MGDVYQATLDSLKAAAHLRPEDKGAIEALLALALKIDGADDTFTTLSELAAQAGSRPPSPDNVSFPTYLKYCESLGLTPAGRERIGLLHKDEQTDEASVRLARLRSVHGTGKSG